jgi:hypothetical protein
VPTLSGTSQARDGVVLSGFTAFGADLRYRPSPPHALNLSLAELGDFTWTERGAYCENGAAACPDPVNHRTWPTTWTTQLTLGLSESVPGAVTFNLGVGLGARLLVEGRFSSAAFDSAERSLAVAFGSVQRSGLRPLPLIHVPVTESFGIDANAGAANMPAQRGGVETGISYAR